MVELRSASGLKRARLLDRIIDAANRAKIQNPRTLGVMASPPTVTDEGASLPVGATVGWLLSTYPTGFYQVIGTRISSLNRFKTAVISTPTGGNSGLNNGSHCSLSKIRFVAEAAKVFLRLDGSTLPYRFLVDGQYVDLTGTTPGATSGDRYISLDFASVGGRARREITVELQAAQAFSGVYLGATSKLTIAPGPVLKSVSIWDSWGYGSSATHLGDGIDAVMADHLGWDSHMNSGSGGTGWATTIGYNFLQRIQNGDAALNGAPDVIKTGCSINDKNFAAATITANALLGLQTLRAAYPDALIIFFGVWPATGGTGGSGVTLAQNEAAGLAAFTAFADSFSIYVPVNAATGGAPLSGSGYVGATTGTGNADFDMFDGSHLNTVGTGVMGKWEADQVLSGVVALRETLAT